MSIPPSPHQFFAKILQLWFPNWGSDELCQEKALLGLKILEKMWLNQISCSQTRWQQLHACRAGKGEAAVITFMQQHGKCPLFAFNSSKVSGPYRRQYISDVYSSSSSVHPRDWVPAGSSRAALQAQPSLGLNSVNFQPKASIQVFPWPVWKLRPLLLF